MDDLQFWVSQHPNTVGVLLWVGFGFAFCTLMIGYIEKYSPDRPTIKPERAGVIVATITIYLLFALFWPLFVLIGIWAGFLIAAENRSPPVNEYDDGADEQS